MNTMHVDDFVVLGRTVPEDSRKYGKRICMAGFSRECNQFVRVYPLMVPVGANWDANSFRARHRYALDLQRNPNDNRPESWRVVDERRPTSTVWDKAAEAKTKDVTEWLLGRSVDSIKALNRCKLSLGAILVRGEEWEGVSVPRDRPDASEDDRDLFADLVALDEPDAPADRVRFAPYIHFKDADGDHKLQVREWGAYRLLANPTYGSDPDALWAAPGYRRGKDLLLVVGNMCNRRTNWLVIKTFEMATEPVGGLFDGMA